MRHNRLSGSRLLSSSAMTVFNDSLTAFNALSQWTSLTTCGIRHRPTGFHWRIVVKLGAPAWNVSTRRNGLETRDEILRRFGSRQRRDPRRTGPRLRRWAFWSRRDRDETVRLETERDVETETTSLQHNEANMRRSIWPLCSSNRKTK